MHAKTPLFHYRRFEPLAMSDSVPHRHEHFRRTVWPSVGIQYIADRTSTSRSYNSTTVSRPQGAGGSLARVKPRAAAKLGPRSDPRTVALVVSPTTVPTVARFDNDKKRCPPNLGYSSTVANASLSVTMPPLQNTRS